MPYALASDSMNLPLTREKEFITMLISLPNIAPEKKEAGDLRHRLAGGMPVGLDIGCEATLRGLITVTGRSCQSPKFGGGQQIENFE
jgi:hypothetical protein